jgi:histidinol-phosphate aminotransferase
MKYNVNETLFSIKPYIPGKPIDEVKRELGLKKVIKLASNENPFPISPKVKQAIVKAISDVNRYPDGDCFYLREKLARHLKVKPKQLIFGNGSDEIIVFAARAFLKTGDEVIVAYPSFLIYEIASKLEGAEVRSIGLKNLRYDLDGMLAAITKSTKIIFLGNPDNPAGTYFSQKEMEGFLKRVPQEVLVFIDEAYFEYVHARDYVRSIDLLKTYPNVIVTRTFSKMYGLAGLRIGYGIADETLVDILNRVREPFNVNSLAQVAAMACLDDQGYYKTLAKKVEQERQFLYKAFKKLKIDFAESCTNFILLKVNKTSQEVVQGLMKKGVIVRDMSHWGLKQFVRITIGTREENNILIRVLEEVL